jgi:hypothetical protein
VTKEVAPCVWQEWDGVSDLGNLCETYMLVCEAHPYEDKNKVDVDLYIGAYIQNKRVYFIDGNGNRRLDATAPLDDLYRKENGDRLYYSKFILPNGHEFAPEFWRKGHIGSCR